MSAAVVDLVACDFAGVLTEPLPETFKRFADRAGITVPQFVDAMREVTELSGLPGHDVISLGHWTEARWGGHLADALERRTGHRLDLSAFGADWWFPGRARNDEFLAYLATLREEGVRLAMITNNVKEWEPSWRAMIPETDELFEIVTNSCEVGFVKPDVRIFDLTAERLGVSPERCVMVDDLAENGTGASAAGWRAVQFTETAEVIAQLDALLGRPTAV
ncbi:HAD-IA family hydrolase [Streptomyces sp. NPDC007905]|uniref:HAD family hydrolase n=1 Tax=Streptomyces sp. NPDC007905 TaxID=3364788 RepID=UPI0036EB4654